MCPIGGRFQAWRRTMGLRSPVSCATGGTIWRDHRAEEKPIKVLIVCAMGMSSSLLETKTIEAGKNAGVEVKMHAITTPDVGMWDWQANWVDVVLVAPQGRYNRKRSAQAPNPPGVVV